VTNSADIDARRAPVNGSPRGTIAWPEHEKAWEAYHRRHSGQSAETIAARGGFGIEELTYQLGHLPATWLPGAEALRQMEYFGVTPASVIPPDVGAR
jgi:hypothetical protein